MKFAAMALSGHRGRTCDLMLAFTPPNEHQPYQLEHEDNAAFVHLECGGATGVSLALIFSNALRVYGSSVVILFLESDVCPLIKAWLFSHAAVMPREALFT
ncbi:hypothetical protein [Pseudomonas sp. Ant30-3]|uniref:hypothetical protein n=1 Tax=Pseudomonas sp. Ant30-3 TaxID=1488328 RepID=UPI0013786252|nr:hypothetical protein [Pseudomonas sp. Ant30-3]